jgi:predicted DNA binding CopG/RHH family protein
MGRTAEKGLYIRLDKSNLGQLKEQASGLKMPLTTYCRMILIQAIKK